jgi:type II secretory pathway pseudopilin PulG
MSKRTLAQRLRSRLRGERGFTIVETVVAMVVIFGSLTALAYTATIGFRYISYGRDRQQATAFANEIMEEIRGQAYAVIERGMSSADLGGDPRIQTCGTDQCFDGERIVASAVGAETAPWIIPHSGSAQTGNLDVDWATYVTNDDPASSPYSVTVFVTWDGTGAISNAPNNLIRLQSDFWSPSGCLSTDTHPFAAPCQPFFYGLAEVPEGSITFTGDLHEGFVDFDTGVVTFPGARATVQQEQVTAVDAAATESRISFRDSSGLEEAAGVTAEADADTDPASSYPLTGGATLAGSGDSLERMQTDCCDEMGLRFTVDAGQTGVASASTSASAADADACPPSGTREADALPCAGAEIRQVNPVTATVPFDHVTAIGDAQVVRMTGPASASMATAERDAVTSADGLIDVQATRVLPDLYLGGFPTSGMSPLTGMSATDTDAENYCMRVTGYSDSARVYAGEQTATAPTASIDGGTFSYYDSATQSYSSLPVTDAALDSLSFTCSKSVSIDGDTVQWFVSVNAASGITGITHAQVPAPKESTDPVSSQIKLETESTVQPIRITFDYELRVNGAKEIDLVVTVDPGTLLTSGIYGPPPEAG